MKRTDVLKNKRYGIMIHYLNGIQNGKGVLRNPVGKSTGWDECVNDLDVELLADNVQKTGAGYVIFSLCQVGANICAPSSVFEQITDYGCDGACSKRDIPLELAHALQKRGIDLYLYFTGDGPRGDEHASKAFGTLNHTDGTVCAEFVKKWASVMEELAYRYGSLVKGWWIDGCFDYIGYNDELLEFYREAALKGNPDALITFNNGVVRLDMADPDVLSFIGDEKDMSKAIDIIDKKAKEGSKLAASLIKKYDTPKKYRYSIHEDFTAGESSFFNEIPAAGEVDGVLWHVMSFLGISYCTPLEGIECGWCGAGSRYSAEYMNEYINKVNQKGGVVTVDVFMDRYGRFDIGQLEILSRIK